MQWCKNLVNGLIAKLAGRLLCMVQVATKKNVEVCVIGNLIDIPCMSRVGMRLIDIVYEDKPTLKLKLQQEPQNEMPLPPAPTTYSKHESEGCLVTT